MSDSEVDLKGPLRRGAGDGDIAEMIRSAIVAKPQRYGESCDEGHVKKCMREMTAIGG
jgi:molybdenum cofactor biosynthesis enzyme MoaA